MKISIELKDKKYKVTYGQISATGNTVKEAVENLANQFKEQVSKFFTAQ